jgi:Immunoglobulin I-set domain
MEGFQNRIKYLVLKVAMCLILFGVLVTSGHAQLGTPPNIIVQPLGLSVQKGGTAVITTTAVSLTTPTFKWLFNGKKIKDDNATVINVVVPLVGTVSTLTLKEVASQDAGNFSVQVVNAAGSVTSSNATMIVLASTISSFGMVANGFKLQLSGPTGSNIVIQASTDLNNWTSISTNLASAGGIAYTDTAAQFLPFRYYRAIIK